MGTAGSVVAGLAVWFGLRWGFTYVSAGNAGLAYEVLRLGVDMVSAAVAGAAVSRAAASLASVLFFVTFCSMFLVDDGPFVWFEVARLPLLPGCVLLGGKLMRLVRRAG